MNLKRKSRAGQGDGDCGSPPDIEAYFWRLIVLFGLACLIIVMHGIGHFGACFPRKNLTPPVFANNRMAWISGLPEGDGLCQVDWLEKVVGNPQTDLPHLAGVHFSEGQPVFVAAIHPRAALLFFQPVPLNLADLEVLAALPGIGPALAARIVAKREELGGFQNIWQLRQVRGIGAKTLNNIQDLLTLG